MSNAYEPRTYGPERRALYDVQRRLVDLEANSSSAPVPVMQWNAAWGQVAYGTSATNQAFTGTSTDITGLTATFTAVAGRNYKVTGFLNAYAGVANSIVQARIVNPGGQAYVEATLQLPVAFWADQLRLQFITSSATGTTTFKVQCSGPSGSGWSTHNVAGPNFILIEDIGPTSGAIPIENPTPAWINLALTNGYIGQTGAVPQYRKVGDIVSLRGRAVGTASYGAFATLPVGYRPVLQDTYTVPTIVGASWQAQGVIYVNSNGDMSMQTGTHSEVGLTGVVFSVTP